MITASTLEELIRKAPVQHLLEYEIRKFELGLGSQTTDFQGEPSPELDARWDSLYHSE